MANITEVQIACRLENYCRELMGEGPVVYGSRHMATPFVHGVKDVLIGRQPHFQAIPEKCCYEVRDEQLL